MKYRSIRQSAAMSQISRTLLKQRIRNAIMAHLLGASHEEIAKWGAFEEINTWQDIVPNGWEPDFFNEPVFSISEQAAIQRFCQIWDTAANATADDVFDVELLRKSPEWINYAETAKSALDVFEERGRFSDEVEAF